MPLQTLFCRHKKQFYWMQIIFLSGTKCLWLPHYVNGFLVWHKKFGLAQIILGQDIRMAFLDNCWFIDKTCQMFATFDNKWNFVLATNWIHGCYIEKSHPYTKEIQTEAFSKWNIVVLKHRAATAWKAGKVWSLPRFWVSIRSYKKQPVKKFFGRILDLAWLIFAMAALMWIYLRY